MFRNPFLCPGTSWGAAGRCYVRLFLISETPGPRLRENPIFGVNATHRGVKTPAHKAPNQHPKPTGNAPGMTQQTSTHVVESFCGCGVPTGPKLVTFTPQVILLNSVKRPKLIDLSKSPMHHRDTSTGHACPLGIPMCRLEACGSRWIAVTRGTRYALQTSLHRGVEKLSCNYGVMY